MDDLMDDDWKFYEGKMQDDELLAIIETYRDIDFFANFVEFCRLKRQGLRKPSLAKLDLFITDCKTQSIAEQRKIVKELYDLPTVIRVKSLNDYMLACVKDWLNDEPNNADLYYWVGKITNDKFYFFKGLEIDPSNLECAKQVILTKLDFVDYQLHHVSESQFVYDAGDENDGKLALQEVHDLLEKYPQIDNWIKREYQEIKQLFNDWLRFKDSDFDDFPNWCQAHNRNYGFIPAYYYTKD